MKLGAHSNALLSNHQGQSEQFSIGDVAIVIDILRNRLYMKKITTMVQEYICNARDACREAKHADNDFEVTVPTPLNPIFKVRDHGIGVSPDRMSNVFIRYGASTKRSDNVATGGFGLGAKIGFAVSDSFSIITYIDGVKRSYVAHVGVSNQGQLDFVSEEQTNEKNGTEIQVPIKTQDIRECRESVLRAVYFWKDRPVLRGLANEHLPTLVKGYSFDDNSEMIDRGLLPSFTEGSSSYQPMIIIDGIPYQLDDVFLNKCQTLRKLMEFCNRKLMLRIGNGVVEVAASRESIADSPLSIKAIEKLALEVSTLVKKHIGDEFKKVKGTGEWIETYKRLSEVFKIEAGFAKYGDYGINYNNITSPMLGKVNITEVSCLGRNRQKINKITKTLTGRNDFPLEHFDKIYLEDTKESAIFQNRRIRAHFEQPQNRLFYLIEPKPVFKVELVLDKNGQPTYDKDGHKITTSTFISDGIADYQKVVKDLAAKAMSTMTYEVLPKEKRVKIPREKTEFCLHVFGGSRHLYTTLSDNTTHWLYIPFVRKDDNNGDDIWQDSCGVHLELLKEMDDYFSSTRGIRICGVAERALKMVEGNPNFKPFKEYMDNYVMSKKELNYAKTKIARNNKYVDLLVNLTGIKDKTLTKMIGVYTEIYKGTVPDMPRNLLDMAKKLVTDFQNEDLALDALIQKKYSLLREFGYGKVSQEIVVYLNAKFDK